MTNGRDHSIVEDVASLARQGLGQVTEAELNHGWQRLANRLEQGQHLEPPISLRPQFAWGKWALAGAAAVVLGIVAYRLPLQRSDSPLHYVVEGATVAAAETITATSAARVLFSDESSLGIETSAKLKVLGTDAHGAQVAITDGSIDVMVTPRRHSSWRFEAGPFSILVKGTSFRLGFDAAKGRLDLHMKSGVVEVLTPREDRALTLRAGESLQLFVNPPREAPIAAPLRVTQETPRPEVPTTLSLPTPAETPQASRLLAKHASPGSPGRLAMHEGALPGQSLSWSELIAKGDFSSIVQDAERRGLDVTLARGSAQELITLADAARYTRKYETARQALLALRARFAGSARAKDAAFFLGRLSEVGPASSDAALTWYDTYLAEAGRGPYASESLGRKLTLLVHRDRELAQQTARTYLQRFPQGNQAELARSVVQSTTE
ncbi:MAG TPA: tetratricopeptide repeat protein [Polyangia bacterium]|nr:tetratricopeptide repeat protein [Polyangia bacterium]